MKVKKSYIDAVKDTLNCYSLLKGHLEFLELNLKVLQGNDGIYGIRYDSTRVQTSTIMVIRL